MTRQTPLVSVCTLAYNHEEFISGMIEGVLAQKTNFPFELIIHDDASTDNTAGIIKDYETRYPEVIKGIYQEQNQWQLGVKATPTFVWPATSGKYIAFCEGDDYWTNPDKLQMQIDFLKNNPNCTFVHTDVDYLNMSDGTLQRSVLSTSGDITQGDVFEELLRQNHISTVTVVFRKSLLDKINLEELHKFPMTDRFLWLEFAKQGDCGFIPESTAVYRINQNSATSRNNILKRINFIKSSTNLVYHFIDKYGCSKSTKEVIYKKAFLNGFTLNSMDIAGEAFSRLSECGAAGIMISLLNTSVKKPIYPIVKKMYQIFSLIYPGVKII